MKLIAKRLFGELNTYHGRAIDWIEIRIVGAAPEDTK